MRFYTGQHQYYCGVDLHARVHDPEALELLRTIPGVDKILALPLLHEIHRSAPTPKPSRSQGRPNLGGLFTMRCYAAPK